MAKFPWSQFPSDLVASLRQEKEFQADWFKSGECGLYNIAVQIVHITMDREGESPKFYVIDNSQFNDLKKECEENNIGNIYPEGIRVIDTFVIPESSHG